MTDKVKEISVCRACGAGGLANVMDLGEQWLPGFYDSVEQGMSEGKQVPLVLCLCPHCGLLQLRHTTPPDWLFRTFHYRSGITATMRQVLHDIVEEIHGEQWLERGDAVCDIGANDGTLLRFYPQEVTRIGFEPALNLADECAAGGNIVVSDYFSAGAEGVPTYFSGFKAITAIAMFYDLDDPQSFLNDVRRMLHPDGVFVLQMNYLLTMVGHCTFDNIGHEHLCYYSLGALRTLLHKTGFHIAKVRLNNVNGGSIQVWCRPGIGREPMLEITPLIEAEEKEGLGTPKRYAEFAENVEMVKRCIKGMLNLHPKNKCYLLGASTRGSTLMQTLGVNTDLVTAAGERDERKWGKFMAGTWIPIIPEQEMRNKAHVALVLPWHFRDEIVARERDWLARGGALIFPLPMPERVDVNSLHALHEKEALPG